VTNGHLEFLFTISSILSLMDQISSAERHLEDRKKYLSLSWRTSEAFLFSDAMSEAFNYIARDQNSLMFLAGHA
jgi:hypothetical protein